MNGIAGLLPLLLLIVIMYFMLIRPQKKREKQVNQMRSNVQVGDEVITIGGICGKIVKTKDDTLVIQVGADKVKFEIMRWAVSKVVESPTRPKKEATVVETEEETPVKKVMPKKMKRATPVEEVSLAKEMPVTEEVPASEPDIEIEDIEVVEAEIVTPDETEK